MSSGPVAFVLGGGGVLGAVEVGMLRALLEYGVRPDLIVGTSVGAVNGVLVAADPTPSRGRTHLHSAGPLRALLERELGAEATFADLAVRFQCCAASIERAAEQWFDRGPVVPAVLASSAVPALLPPVLIDGQHYIDGGIVNSIPVGRAVELGAGTVFVLQVGRIDRPLSAPRHVLDVAKVAFEIARRHRYARELAAIPSTVDVHVLPTGGGSERDDSPLAYRDLAAAARRINRAYEASVSYLKDRLG